MTFAQDTRQPAGTTPSFRSNYCHAFAICVALLGLGGIACAADDLSPAPQAAQSGGAAQDVENYFADWFNRVDAASATQPSWAAPLNTVTPLLKEFVQYSQTYKTLPNGAAVTTYDGGTTPGPGVHLIPTYYNEVFIGAPPYQVQTITRPAAGFADWPFLVIKTRLASGNEQNGDYVVSAFLSGQAPIGIKPITPTIQRCDAPQKLPNRRAVAPHRRRELFRTRPQAPGQ